MSQESRSNLDRALRGYQDNINGMRQISPADAAGIQGHGLAFLARALLEVADAIEKAGQQ